MRALLLAAVLGGAACGAAPPAPLTADQARMLRGRPWLAVARETLVIEWEVYGPWHRQVERTADRLGDSYQADGTWESEAVCRRVVLEARIRLDGAGHHRTVDARLFLAEALAQEKRTSAQRDALRRASAQQHRAMALHFEGKTAMALPLAREAAALRERVLGGRHHQFAECLNTLALLHQAMGGNDAALPLFKQSVAIRKAVLGEGHPLHAGGLNNLALLLQARGDYDAALPLFKRAMATTKAALGEKHPHYASSLNNFALLLKTMGDFQAALPLYRQALALQKGSPDEKGPLYATGLQNLAALHVSMGDRVVALPLLKQALAIRKSALGERHPDYASSLNSLAALRHAMRDHLAALPLYKEALALRKEVLGRRHPHHVSSLNNLALLYQDMGDHEAALPLFEEALALRKAALGERHPLYATSLNNLAFLHYLKGDHEAALPLYKRALAVLEGHPARCHPDYVNVLTNFASLMHIRGVHEAALKLTEEALATTSSQLHASASIQSDRQQFATANALRHHLDVRLSLPDVTGGSPPGSKKYSPASAHALAWKGAILLRQQQRRLFLRLADDDTTKAAAKRLQTATRQLAALRLSTRATREQLEALAKRQEEAQSELAGLPSAFAAQREKERVSPEALAASLPEGAVLVDYLFFTRSGLKGKDGRPRQEHHLVAFLHRKGESARKVDLGPAERVEDAVRAWRPFLTSGKPGHAAGMVLKALIWTPLQKHLEDAKVVLVSPDGVLGTVSFAALPGKKEGTYLIEEAAVAVVPVPSAVPDLMRPVDKASRLRPSLLVAGDLRYDPEKGKAPAAGPGAWSAPRTGRETFAALPATAAEILAVRSSFEKAFEGGAARSLSGGAATKAAVGKALASVRYAHLATHGYFAPESVKSVLSATGHAPPGRREVTGWPPLLLSGLALSDANRDPGLGEEDGILTALEVSEMDLTKLELAVLSACETGLGEVAGGEGILGMQRAFQIAGARSVVSSMWKVSDEATRVLMARFYENLWGKGMGRLEALAAAQRWMLREGHSAPGVTRGKVGELLPEKGTLRLPPYYWAAFVLSGDWR